MKPPNFEDLIHNLMEVSRQLQAVEWTFELTFKTANEKWIIKDIEKQITQHNSMVIIYLSGENAYLLPHIEKHHCKVPKTDAVNTEEWKRIK